MQKNNKKFNIIHPFLFSLFPILFIYSQNVHEIPVQIVIMPVLLILFAAVLLWLLTRFILKNNEKSAFIISLLLVLSFSYGHIYLLVDDFTLGNSDIGRHQYLLIPFVVTFIFGVYYFVKTKRRLNNATTISNAIAGALLAFILINIVAYNVENTDSFSGELITSNTSLHTADATIEMFHPTEETIKDYPDVYYIALDGYMNSNALKKYLNHDNQEFVSYLENKGFNVNHKSYSNYHGTVLSITSTFNMMYLNFLTEDPIEQDGLSTNQPILFYNAKVPIPEKMISENAIMQNFKSAGYKIVNIQKPFENEILSSSPLIDLVMCKRSKYIDSELLSMTIKTSILVFLLEKWEQQDLRDAALCQFSELPKQHQKFDEPIFVYSHILIPHPPYLFGSEGEAISSVRPQGLESWENKEGYVNSVKFANKKVIQIVEQILTESAKPPVIIIQADHGIGFDFDPNNPSNESIEQKMSIFSAYYLPGIEKNSSDNDITPVNTFRIIFNSYFNTNYDLLENKIYLSDDDVPGYFLDVTNVLISP